MDSVVTSVSSAPASSSSGEAQDATLIGQPTQAHKPLFEFFGLTRPSDYQNNHHNSALAQIWDWAKTVAPNKDKDSVLFEVMRLKSRLGTPGIENNPYLKLEMYVKNWKQMRDAEERMQALEAKPQ